MYYVRVLNELAFNVPGVGETGEMGVYRDP